MIRNIKDCSPNKGEKYFFDTCVWMYIINPGQFDNKAEQYSRLLNNILQTKATIYTSSLIIAEIWNRYLHEVHDRVSKESNYRPLFKDFRRTNEYFEAQNEIANLIRRQLCGLSKRIDDNFKDAGLDDLMKPNGSIDFNDLYYCYLCKVLNMKLVTHDSDFSHCPFDIEIVTANKDLYLKLLMR